MNFTRHYDLEGQHAFLGASKHAWTNYDPEKIDEAFERYMAVQRGTELHAFASTAIRLRRKQRNTKDAINRFINDAIGFRMKSEQPLYYSSNAFGTADAISFRDGILRIHDLKTGITKVSMRQLEIYAAFFCLEYHEDPKAIEIELRIYQGEDIQIYHPKASDIQKIMDTTIQCDKRLEKKKLEMED
jgi:hypothetical protein